MISIKRRDVICGIFSGLAMTSLTSKAARSELKSHEGNNYNNSNREVLLNCETTRCGNGCMDLKNDRIISLACIELIDTEVTGRFYHLPYQKEFPCFDHYQSSRIADEIRDFIGITPPVAFNARFEMGFVNMEMERLGIEKIDTPCTDIVALARKIWPSEPCYLAAIAQRLHIEFRLLDDETPENTLYDAGVMAECYGQIGRMQNVIKDKTA